LTLMLRAFENEKIKYRKTILCPIQFSMDENFLLYSWAISFFNFQGLWQAVLAGPGENQNEGLINILGSAFYRTLHFQSQQSLPN